MFWSDSDKGDFITCTGQCFLKFTGNIDGWRQLSSIRTLDKLPIDKPSYFEIEVMDGGFSNGIAIGISLKTTETNRPPGWDVGTIGYHGDGKGGIYHHSDTAVEKVNGFKSGDIVGCMVEPFNNGKRTILTVQFSKNGENVGIERMLSDVYVYLDVYPTVALYSENAQVKTSFGNKRLEWKGSLEKGNALILL